MVKIHISISIERTGQAIKETVSKTISLDDTLFKDLEAHMELFKVLADHIQILKEMREN